MPYAKLRNTNGKAKKVKIIKDKFGLKHDGVMFPDGMVFRSSDCIFYKKVEVVDQANNGKNNSK